MALQLYVDKDWEIKIEDIRFIASICEHENVTIYKATWRRFQVVCIKEIRLTSENIDLVTREIDILSKCIHPKVCQYFGFGKRDDHVFLVFEYMENGNLQDYITSNHLTVAQKTQILKSILIGMNYLSSRSPHKIIHRDFKPSNILVNSHGEIKIADFGVSKELYSGKVPQVRSETNLLLVSHSPTQDDISHTGIGTLRWSAPELLLDDCMYDERCDIYSFGLIAYFVLTDGTVPYYDEYRNNHAKIAYDKHQNRRCFLNDPNLDFLKQLVVQCTERDPAMRPSDANTIIDNFFSFE